MVDIQPTTTQPISDDQELAKVLAGVSQQADTGLQFEETPPSIPAPVPAPAPEPVATPDPIAVTPQPLGDDLTPIKTEAINELRPLVDKLDLPAEEKFETYLLLIRSSDDKSLIAPAHQTALLIEDETKRAEALLDIIKEIEYLSSSKN